MNPIEEKEVECPHCGETFAVVIDCMSENQMYIEDCEVCCSPIEFTVRIEDVENSSQMSVSVSATQ